MKKLLIAMSLVLLSGCEGITSYSYKKVCLDNVVYYQMSKYYQAGLAPAYNEDGSLKLCLGESIERPSISR